MKSEDFIQLRLLLGTYVTAPFPTISQDKLEEKKRTLN